MWFLKRGSIGEDDRTKNDDAGGKVVSNSGSEIMFHAGMVTASMKVSGAVFGLSASQQIEWLRLSQGFCKRIGCKAMI